MRTPAIPRAMLSVCFLLLTPIPVYCHFPSRTGKLCKCLQVEHRATLGRSMSYHPPSIHNLWDALRLVSFLRSHERVNENALPGRRPHLSSRSARGHPAFQGVEGGGGDQRDMRGTTAAADEAVPIEARTYVLTLEQPLREWCCCPPKLDNQTSSRPAASTGSGATADAIRSGHVVIGDGVARAQQHPPSLAHIMWQRVCRLTDP